VLCAAFGIAIAGKACRINIQPYVDEEENLDLVDTPERTLPITPRAEPSQRPSGSITDSTDSKGFLLRSFRRGKFKRKISPVVGLYYPPTVTFVRSQDGQALF
jgi:hypothetical protein